MLLAGALLSASLLLGNAPKDAPLVPGARSLEEPGRYLSPRNYEDTLEYYRRTFKGHRDVRWRHIVNLPGIRAQHLQCLRSSTKWEGINIYEHKGKVKLYVLPRRK